MDGHGRVFVKWEFFVNPVSRRYSTVLYSVHCTVAPKITTLPTSNIYSTVVKLLNLVLRIHPVILLYLILSIQSIYQKIKKNDPIMKSYVQCFFYFKSFAFKILKILVFESCHVQFESGYESAECYFRKRIRIKFIRIRTQHWWKQDIL